jgi:hypothetical protein
MYIYWVLIKKNVDRGSFVPSYEILEKEPPEGKKEALPPDHYLDLFKCRLSKDGTHVICDLYRVSNLDGQIIEEKTETILLQRD